MRRFALAAVLLAVAAGPAIHPAWAGAWPQEAGHGQVIVQGSWYRTHSVGTGPQGQKVPAGTYNQIELAPYIEYGLTDRWTVGAQPRAQYVTSGGMSAGGLVETNLFARYALARWGSNVVAVQGLVGLPGTATARTPYVANPHAEYEMRLLFGRGFTLGGGMSGFVDAEFAGRARTGGDANETRLDVTFGLRPQPRWLLLAQSFNTLGLRDGRPGGADYSVSKLQLSAVYWPTPALGVQFGAYREIAGRNMPLGTAGLVALWLPF